MTLADVVIAATVKYFFENVLDAGKRKSLPATTRWFETCLSVPAMEQALGKVAYCSKVKVPQAKGGKQKKKGGDKAKGGKQKNKQQELKTRT